MHCSKCGSSIPENSKFCPQCGNPSSTTPDSASSAPNHAASTKKTKSLICILCIASIICALFLFSNRSVSEFKSLFQGNEFTAARQIYDTLSERERSTVDHWLVEYVTSIEEEYYSGKQDFRSSDRILSEALSYPASYEAAYNAQIGIDLDSHSSELVAQAKKQAASSQWDQAYLTLQDINISYRLYDEVQVLSTEYRTNYQNQVLHQMSDLAKTNDIAGILALHNYSLTVLKTDNKISQACQGYTDSYIDSVLKNAESFLTAQDYDSLSELAEQSLRICPTDRLITGFADIYYQAYITRFVASTTNGDYQYPLNMLYILSQGEVSHIFTLDTIFSHNPNEKSRYQTLYNQYFDEYISILTQQRDYRAILELISNQKPAIKNGTDLFNQYAALLVEQTLTAAQNLADTRDFSGAIKTITSVQTDYDCAQFQEAIDNYKEYLPRSITECHLITDNFVHFGAAIDSYGNEYSPAIYSLGSGTAYDPTTIYLLGGKFIRFTGTFAPHKGCGRSDTLQCRIYADDILIYESQKITLTSSPITIDIDITSVQQLKIVFIENINGPYGRGACILSGNVS